MMAAKTVFISSTYTDMVDHRRAVWDVLQKFDVTIRGMEQFGARTTTPLDTCLAEVEQSDIYVGIVGFRFGSIEQRSRKSYTQCEYEHAVSHRKEVLIYIADEDAAIFPVKHVDLDGRLRRRLNAFKDRLREKHTVDTFSTPENLAERLERDFQRHFPPSKRDQAVPDENPYKIAEKLLREFWLTPEKLNGHEVRLSIDLFGDLYPVSRSLCQKFNLEYGYTVGCSISIKNPGNKRLTAGLGHLYATGKRVDSLKALHGARSGEVYASLRFSPEDVEAERAEFFTRTAYLEPDFHEYGDPNEVLIPAEGRTILLLSKVL